MSVIQMLALALLYVASFTWLAVYDDPETTVEIVETVETVEALDVEVITLPKNFKKSCQANMVVAESFAACVTHPKCSLTIDETAVMYQAGKTAIIDCRAAEMIQKLFDPPARVPFLQPLDDDKVISI